MKTIIAPLYLHQSLKKYLMNQTMTNYLVGYKFVDPTNFFHEFLPIANRIDYVKLYHELSLLNLVVFKDYLQNKQFIDYFIKVTREFIKHNVPINDLDESSISNVEIKKIIQTISNVNLIENKYYLLKELLNKDFSDYIIFDDFAEIFFNELYEIMISNNATRFDNKVNSEPVLFSALNKREEIEIISQEIIKQNYLAKDVNIICSSNTYYPLIEQVFNRYKIPYNIIQNKDNIISPKIFISLYKLAKEYTLDNFIEVISLNAFNVNLSSYYFIEYLKIFGINNLTFDYYHNADYSNIKNLVSLETQAKKYYLEIQEKLDDLLNVKDEANLLELIFNFIIEFDEKKVINKIKTIINNYTNIDSISVNYILQEINSITIYKKYNNYDAISITTINKPILNNKVTFICGLDQSNYPGFKSNSGYVDEFYLKETSYLKEEVRYDHHMYCLKWLLNNGNKSYFSYPISNFTGKPKDLSYYIEELSINKIHIDYIKNDTTNKMYNFKNEYEFPPEFSTTVYKVEDYFGCRLKYYLAHLLKIKKIDYQLNYNLALGNINHKLVELFTTEENINIDKLFKLNNIIFNELKYLYPMEFNKLVLIEKLNYDLMKIFNDKLINFHDNSNYKISNREYRLEHNLNTSNNLILKGIVDRIDTNDTCFRVIDYKSSDARISLSKIYTAEKLQLITYLYILSKEKRDYTPAGILYINFVNNLVDATPYIYKRGEFQKNNDSNLYNEYLKENNISTMLFDEDNHGNNLSKAKLNNLSREEIFEDLEKIYQIFEHEVTTLDFNPDPIQNKCDFCDFITICHFKNIQRKAIPLVEREVKDGKK